MRFEKNSVAAYFQEENTLIIRLIRAILSSQRWRVTRQMWYARIERGITLWRYHPHGSIYLNDKWSAPVLPRRWSFSKRSRLAWTTRACKHAYSWSIREIRARDAVLYCTYRLGRHIDFQFSVYVRTRAKPLSLSRRWRMLKKRCNPGVLNPRAARCKSAATTRANVNYSTSRPGFIQIKLAGNVIAEICNYFTEAK